MQGLVKGYKELDIPFKLLSKQENAKGLAIMLPGAGYTTQSPLFHFAAGIFVNKSFDVLQVNYQYNSDIYKDWSMEELVEAINYDVRAVLEHVLRESQYESFYVIGKSLGTIAMSEALNLLPSKAAKAVWLTPLIQRDDVYNAMLMSENQGLCYIGDQDPCYDQEKFQQICCNENIQSTLIQGVEHSLQYADDPVQSIDVLKRVISEMAHF